MSRYPFWFWCVVPTCQTWHLPPHYSPLAKSLYEKYSPPPANWRRFILLCSTCSWIELVPNLHWTFSPYFGTLHLICSAATFEVLRNSCASLLTFNQLALPGSVHAPTPTWLRWSGEALNEAPGYAYGPVRFFYNSSFLTYFFSRNSVFSLTTNQPK